MHSVTSARLKKRVRGLAEYVNDMCGHGIACHPCVSVLRSAHALYTIHFTYISLINCLYMLNIGDVAPDFTLPDQDGAVHSLRDYRGKWIVLYFYPKDDTPGCTQEACGMRDRLSEFVAKDAVVLGVSKDSSASHKKFVGKYSLPFTLLSDTDTSMQQSYGAWQMKSMMGRSYTGTQRMTFIIDPKGTIAHIYQTVKPPEHADEVLRDLAKLQ